MLEGKKLIHSESSSSCRIYAILSIFLGCFYAIMHCLVTCKSGKAAGAPPHRGAYSVPTYSLAGQEGAAPPPKI